MQFDFSTVTNRRGTGSIKWAAVESGKPLENAFPFSTADMEFSAPPAVKKAVAEFAEKGFFCYTVPDEKYKKAVCDFMLRRHDWKIRPEWIVPTYGIVSAINTAVRAFTKEDDGIIVQHPVYRPFFAAVENNNRKLVNNALIFEDNTYKMNFEELERLCRDERNKMMILCSPHNPVCRVWTKEELTKVADLCLENGVLLISDEIHFDIVKNRHFVLTSLDERYLENTVVCTAVSKSFNIAGLSTSNIIIANEELRERFSNRISRDGYSCINCAAYPATIAAYTECDEWLDEMNAKVNENFDLLSSFLSANLPELSVAKHEGTYLAWVNVSSLGLGEKELKELLGEKAGIIPSFGSWFGEEGEGFIRLNVAVPSEALLSALERLEKAVKNR